MNNDGTVIDFDKVKDQMLRNDENLPEEMENQINILLKGKKFKEALDLSIKTLNEISERKIENEVLSNKIKSHVIKLNNINAMNCLQKGENEMAKYFLEMSEKFSHKKDLESYLLTKNNFCCYYSNIGQFRGAKNIMNELLKINTLKKVNEMCNFNNQQEEINYNNIANDYSNICALDNKLKNYNDSLVDGLHALALNQLTILNQKLSNKSKLEKENNSNMDNNLLLCYYNIGVQQEYLKREHDSQVSFNKSKMLSNSKVDLNLSKKVKINSNMTNLTDEINFKDSFSNNELSSMKYENFHIQEKIAKFNKMEEFSHKFKNNPYFVASKKNFDKYKIMNNLNENKKK